MEDGNGLTALKIAIAKKKTDVAKLLQGMMLSKYGKSVGEKKAIDEKTQTAKGGKQETKHVSLDQIGSLLLCSENL